MSGAAELFAELRADVVALADPLIEQAQSTLRSRGRYLPQAAVLCPEGRVTMVGAMMSSKDGFAQPEQVLTMLSGGLRQMARERVLVAVAVAATYSIMRGDQQVQAIRVLVEHERGLSVAMFVPFRRTEIGSHEFQTPFVQPVPAELKLWAPVPAS
jgi:hypothetical protein